jgi:hypothetical protein
MPKRGPLIGALAVSALLVVVAANGAGIINNPTAGYLLCINTKTKVVTHPGTATCPMGTKGLVVGSKGQDGAAGLTGATGLNGQNGRDGLDGKTLWNGIKDPENTWGSPGDMFINSITKTLFGPKNLDGTWPVGVSMVGPKGDQGPSGGSGPAGPQGATGVAEPVVTGANCIGTKCTYKIGDTGPGGGLIFFVDYFNQYAGFNYLEASPSECEAQRSWSAYDSPVPAAEGWAARAVGRGQTNTTAIIAAVTALTIPGAPAAAFADGSTCGGKTDWFLGSLGEMKLIYDNLQGLGGFVRGGMYWSSTELDKDTASTQEFNSGWQSQEGKEIASTRVRPVRAF